MKFPHRAIFACRVVSIRSITVLLFFVSGFGAGVASADDVVVPNRLETTEGDGNNCLPLTGC